MAENANTIDTTNDTITAANAVIFRNTDTGKQFLLVEENDGQWGLAGGAKDIEDSDISVTLSRELQEELSLTPTDYQNTQTSIRAEFQYDHRSSTRFGKKGIIIFFVVEVTDIAKIKTSGELKSVAWFSKTEAVEKLSFEVVKNGFQSVTAHLK